MKQPLMEKQTIQFTFPNQLVAIQSIDKTKIKPHWEETANGITGVYHIAVDVLFDNEPLNTQADTEAVSIPFVEVKDQVGYFEYAMPFEKSMDTDALKEVKVVNLHANVLDHQVCELEWEVHFIAKEPVPTAHLVDIKAVQTEQDDEIALVDDEAKQVLKEDDLLVTDEPKSLWSHLKDDYVLWDSKDFHPQ